MDEQPTEREEILGRIQTASRPLDQTQPGKFPQVTGLCRTCSRAWIWKRQYDEYPNVLCHLSYERPVRMPLDVAECTEYDRRGEPSLRELSELATLIDPRHNPGQFL